MAPYKKKPPLYKKKAAGGATASCTMPLSIIMQTPATAPRAFQSRHNKACRAGVPARPPLAVGRRAQPVPAPGVAPRSPPPPAARCPAPPAADKKPRDDSRTPDSSDIDESEFSDEQEDEEDYRRGEEGRVWCGVVSRGLPAPGGSGRGGAVLQAGGFGPERAVHTLPADPGQLGAAEPFSWQRPRLACCRRALLGLPAAALPAPPPTFTTQHSPAVLPSLWALAALQPRCPTTPAALQPCRPALAPLPNSGGYHPVRVGEQFKDGRYTVLHKLGWGHFSTVWMVLDNATGQQAAMKV